MGVRQVRRRIGETITWTPAHDAHYMVAAMRGASRTAPPLHVTQSALVQLETLLATDDTPVPFGLLLGSMCLAPEAPGPYLLVNDMTPSTADLTPEDPVTQLTKALRSLVTAAARRRSLVIGWYIGGMGDDLSLDEEILSMHGQLFPEPWHVLLVHGRAAGFVQGAFLRIDPIELRLFPTPFAEALPEWKRRKASEETPSAVQWSSYRANRAVVPIQSQRTRPALPKVRTETPSVWSRLPLISAAVLVVLVVLVAIAYAGVR
jgi:hypothetical protein